MHTALGAHVPGHGSLHFILIHVRWYEHSLLLTHSGRQFGGEPMKLGAHEHDGEFPLTWHWEFGPQGDGKHGFCTGSGGTTCKW